MERIDLRGSGRFTFDALLEAQRELGPFAEAEVLLSREQHAEFCAFHGVVPEDAVRAFRWNDLTFQPPE